MQPAAYEAGVRRRDFLLGSLALGAFVRQGFADATVGAPLTRVRRPLLVLVVPDDDGEKQIRGEALGAFLMHASDAQLAPLSDVDVACAQRAPTDALLVLLTPDGRVALAAARGLPARKWDDDAAVDAQIAFVAGKVRSLLGRGPADVARAAARVRQRLVAQAPAGAHWARASECGYEDVEGMSDPEADERMAVDCGMGHVPEKSRRFLYFWSQTPARRALAREGL
jgi:hypothetical protein